MTDRSPITLRVPALRQTLQMYVHGERDQFVSQRLREEGVWEAYESTLLLKLLQPGDVFVDVGANIGYFSLLAASVVGAQGTVFAFEPDPDNYRLLQANIELNAMGHCIAPVQAALSTEHAQGRLYLSEHNLGDHQIYASQEPRSSVPIVRYHGADYLRERLQRLDLLKVDTQGAEFQVIAGLMPLLQDLDAKPRMIVELTPHSLREAGASGRALVELIATLNQPLWIVDHVAGELLSTTAEDLSQWCDNWDKVAESKGFINILVGDAP